MVYDGIHPAKARHGGLYHLLGAAILSEICLQKQLVVIRIGDRFAVAPGQPDRDALGVRTGAAGPGPPAAVGEGAVRSNEERRWCLNLSSPQSHIRGLKAVMNPYLTSCQNTHSLQLTHS